MELFTKLGLKEVADIVGTLGRHTDVECAQGTVEVDGKRYFYEKDGNKLSIIDSEGKKVKIGINYSEETYKDEYQRDIHVLKHEVKAKYTLPNGDSIRLYNNVGLNPGYEAFENVQRHDLMRGISMKYCSATGEEVASFSLGLERVCKAGTKTMFDFEDNTIKVGNRTVSMDGKTLLAIGGSPVPSKKVAEDFNIKEAETKIQKFLDMTPELHEFARTEVEDAMRKLTKWKRYADSILEFYKEDSAPIQEIVEIRNRLIAGVEQDVIPPEAMDAVNKALVSTFKQHQAQDTNGNAK